MAACRICGLRGNGAHQWKFRRRLPWLVTLTLTLWLFWVTETQAVDKLVTCEASANQDGGMHMVTCHFPYDLNKTQKNFIAEFFPVTGNSFAVLTCEWQQQQQPPNCFKLEKVSFDNVIASTVVFKVESSIARVGGQFKCGVVPPGETSSQRCDLNEVTTSAATTTTQVTTMSTECAECDVKDHCPSMGGQLAVAVILPSLLTAVVCCAVFYLLLKRHGTSLKDLFQRRSVNHSGDSPSTSPVNAPSTTV